MSDFEQLPETMAIALKQQLGDRSSDYLIPPPVFISMQGKFLAFDPHEASLTARFPVLQTYLNPYHTMQGGMIAAALDNTLGPLSVMVAPPNVTHRLEVIYSQPVRLEMKFITVTGKLVERDGRKLIFRGNVHDPNGVRLARAKALHWIVEQI